MEELPQLWWKGEQISTPLRLLCVSHGLTAACQCANTDFLCLNGRQKRAAWVTSHEKHRIPTTKTISFIHKTHEWGLSSKAAARFIMCRIHGSWLRFRYHQVCGDAGKSHNPRTGNDKTKGWDELEQVGNYRASGGTSAGSRDGRERPATISADLQPPPSPNSISWVDPPRFIRSVSGSAARPVKPESKADVRHVKANGWRGKLGGHFSFAALESVPN